MKENYKIYMHRNKINKKVYIGQTKRPLIKRWGNNGAGYKGQGYFYNAIQKYGWDNFEHIVLFDNINSPKIADRYEEYLIYLYDSTNQKYGYNLRKGGSNSISVNTVKSVFKYSKDGLFLKKYDSISYAENDTGILGSSISLCCNGDLKSAGGFMWRYKYYDQIEKYDDKRKINDDLLLNIYQYTTFGVLVYVFKSMKDLLEKHSNFIESEAAIRACCKQDKDCVMTSCGYVWSYCPMDSDYIIKNLYHYREIHRYNLNGFYESSYNSSRDAANDINVDDVRPILACLGGRRKSAYGYQWKDYLVDQIDSYKPPIRNRKILKCLKNKDIIAEYNNLKDAAMSIEGVELMNAKAGITRCCSGRTKSYFGYVWKYKED